MQQWNTGHLARLACLWQRSPVSVLLLFLLVIDLSPRSWSIGMNYAEVVECSDQRSRVPKGWGLYARPCRTFSSFMTKNLTFFGAVVRQFSCCLACSRYILELCLSAGNSPHFIIFLFGFSTTATLFNFMNLLQFCSFITAEWNGVKYYWSPPSDCYRQFWWWYCCVDIACSGFTVNKLDLFCQRLYC